MYLAFEGVEVWDEHNLAEGKFEVDCPWLGVSLFASSDDYSRRNVDARLRDRALADGQEEVARRLTYLFGGATCTDCGTAFSPADRVMSQWG